MLSQLARFAAPCAALALSACAGGGAAVRRELDALRGDVTALQAQNDALSRRLDAATRRLDELAERSARSARAPAPAPAAPAAPASAPDAPLVPPNLAVVRVAPPREVAAEPEPDRVEEQAPVVLRAPPARAPRVAPPLSTAVSVSEPDPDRLEALGRPMGRELSAEAEGELAAARRKSGVDRAHALEAFVARYPRHPSADNALVEGARDYADAGRLDAACALARRVPEDYPAGDAVSAANEIVARCERSRP